MPDSDKVFAGAIPEVYDTHMVPLIFAGYAEDMARRVAALRPGDVLETAAGSGALTRALAPRLEATARYVATDLNQPMLDRAMARQGPDGRIEWRQADALALPFGDAEFDVVCCQFGVMFFPNKVTGYREARRVLRPGGAFVFNVWDRIGANDLAAEVVEALAVQFPADPPLFLVRTPHGYHDAGEIRSDLEQAEFAEITIETRTDVSRAPDARHLATAFCQGTPIRGEIEARAPGQLDAVTDRVANAIETRHGSGPLAGRIQALVITAQA